MEYSVNNNIYNIFYSSNNNQIDIKQQMKDFFTIFFIDSDNPEKYIIIRFYLSIIKLYVEFYKSFDTSLHDFWDNKIKPYIHENYPQSSSGVFTANSDIHYLLQLIDNLHKEFGVNNDKINEEKNEILIKTSPQPPTPHEDKVSNNEKQDDIKQKINEKNLKNKNLSKRVNSKQEEDIKILRNENLIRINNFLKDFIAENKLNLKRSNSMMSLRHSKTISSITTCADSVYLEEIKNKKYNINLNKLRVDNNENIIDKNIIINNNELYEDISDKKIETKQSKKKFGNFIGIERNQNNNLIINMIPQYKEIEKDNEKIYIEYNEKNELNNISADLLLKKIIFDDFLQKKALLIYHFCQQCFCFLDKEIFFKKLFHCYKIYKSKNIPLDKLKNLIEFINILVIEMFIYYNKINHNEMQIAFIKKNYNELISDLISNFKYEEKILNINNIQKEQVNIEEKNNKKRFRFDSDGFDNENNLFEDIVFDKNNLLNLNLNTHKKIINIFFYKEKEEIKNEKDQNEINSSNNSEVNIKFPSFYRISKTLKKQSVSTIINKLYSNDKIEEIKEENNEDDSISSHSKSSNSVDDINEEIKSEEESNIDEEEEGSVDINDSEQINILLNKVFHEEKIISIKDQLLLQINAIMSLLSLDNTEFLPLRDINKAKSTIQFYADIKDLKKVSKNASQIKLKRVKTVKNPESSLIKNLSISKTKNYLFLNKNYFCVTDWNVEDIGDKLAQISKSNLDKIYPKELYKGIYLKKDKNNSSPNVLNCIQSSSNLTAFIIEDIISYNTPRLRARVYEKWVLICDYCRQNKDHNDCIAIYSALNNYIITGLNLTLKEVKYKIKNTFEQINNFCNVEANYKNIRNDMDLCLKNDESFIPYLGLLLRDINFFEESSKYLNERGCINMDKIEKINGLLEKYFKYKTDDKKFNDRLISDNLNFFENLENNTEEELEKIAENIEPVFKYKNQESKRLTNIDKKYFQKNIFQKRSSFTGNLRLTFGGDSNLLSKFKDK